MRESSSSGLPKEEELLAPEKWKEEEEEEATDSISEREREREFPCKVLLSLCPPPLLLHVQSLLTLSILLLPSIQHLFQRGEGEKEALEEEEEEKACA